MAETENKIIVEAIEKYKYKHNIKYATPQSSLFNTLHVLLLLSVIYFFAFNFFYIAGAFLQLAEAKTNDNYSTVFNSVKWTLFPVLITTCLVIVGLVLTYFSNAAIIKLPLQPIGCFLSASAAIVNVVFYLRAVKSVVYTLDDYHYLFGIQSFFYWRNLLPVLLITAFGVWMGIIYIRAKRKDKAIYDSTVESLWNCYRSGDTKGMSQEEWDSFLQEFDHTGYKKQFDE